jgi:peptidyl-prolyl cis-trans isomerase D
MMKFLRSQSQTVLIVIVLVLGGSFLFYGTGNFLSSPLRGGSDYGRIAGQDVSVAELYDAVRTTRDALILNGQGAELSQPGGRGQLAEEAWRRLLLLHEADRLHIEIADNEVADYIRKQPIFQKDGVYSPDVYQTVMNDLQNKARITPDAFERYVRQSLLTTAVSHALFSALHASPAAVSAAFEKYYGPVQLSVITFDPRDQLAKVQISPADIEAEYKAHPDNPDYRTPEKRKVDYVLFSLTPDQQKLPDKDKTAALETLGDKALNFALAFQPEPTPGPNATTPPVPDFQDEAKKQGLAPATTDFFSADQSPAGVPPSPAFNSAAFALTQDNAVSKVIELDNAVAVLHLAGHQPSELKPLDQVSAQIAAQLKQVQANANAQVAAAFAGQALRHALATNPDLKAAAAALKLNVQTIPAFVPAKVPQTDARLETLAYVATSLQPGELSQPVPMQSDGTTVLIHLDSRSPSDPADQAQAEPRFRAAEDEQLRKTVYIDWANWQDHQPGTHRPPNLDEYGGVE